MEIIKWKLIPLFYKPTDVKRSKTFYTFVCLIAKARQGEVMR